MDKFVSATRPDWAPEDMYPFESRFFNTPSGHQWQGVAQGITRIIASNRVEESGCQNGERFRRHISAQRAARIRLNSSGRTHAGWANGSSSKLPRLIPVI